MNDNVAADVPGHLRALICPSTSGWHSRAAAARAATRSSPPRSGSKPSSGSCTPPTISSPAARPIANFLPLLAERFARQRLRALANVEGKSNDGKPVVLFLCTHNAGRSQMALGFFTHLAGDAAVAWSGGSEPGNEVNPAAVAAMAERRHRHLRRVPQTLDRRDRASRRCRRHHGLRRRLPGVPGAAATRNGSSTTPPARTSTPSARSATTSNDGCAVCSPSSKSASMRSRIVTHSRCPTCPGAFHRSSSSGMPWLIRVSGAFRSQSSTGFAPATPTRRPAPGYSPLLALNGPLATHSTTNRNTASSWSSTARPTDTTDIEVAITKATEPPTYPDTNPRDRTERCIHRTSQQ